MSRSIRDYFHVKDGLPDPLLTRARAKPRSYAKFRCKKKFVGEGRPTNFFKHNNFSNESFITRKFPDLRYCIP